MRALALLLILPLLPACAPADASSDSRLAAKARPEAAPRDTAPTQTRRVWADSAAFDAALVAPTPDGREIVLTDWVTGDLAVLTLGTGQLRRLTMNPAPYATGFGMFPRVSQDGRRVAYGWWDATEPDLWQLRTVDFEGGEPRVVLSSESLYWAQAMDWSADGRSILAWRVQGEDAVDLLVVPADGGEARVLKTLDTLEPRNMAFSPDGGWIAYDLPADEDRIERDVYLLALDDGREVRLIDHPADDRLLGWTPDGGHLLVASDRLGTPAAWLFPVAEGRQQGEPTLVKPDLWQAMGVGFTPDGRFWYSVETGSQAVYSVELDPSTGRPTGSPVQVSGRSAGRSSNPTWSSDGRHVAYLTQSGSLPVNPASLTLRSLESGETRQFAVPPRLRNVLDLSWHPDGRSIVFRAMERGSTSLFRLDLQTGEVSSFFRADSAAWGVLDHDLSPDGRTLVYLTEQTRGGGSGETERTLYVRDLVTGEERMLHRLRAPFRSLQLRNPTVSHDSRTVAFLHWRGEEPSEVMVVPMSGGEPRKVTSAPDLQGPVFDADDTHLMFAAGEQGATDQLRTLYRVPVGGGEPEALGLTLRRLTGLEVHPSSRRLAFSAGYPETELWVMEGFLPQRPPAH